MPEEEQREEGCEKFRGCKTNLFMWLSYLLCSLDSGQRTQFRASARARQVKGLVAKHDNFPGTHMNEGEKL
jgi:sulfur transfer protein SufE